MELIAKGTQGSTRASRATSDLNIEEQITLCFQKFTTYLQTLLDVSVPDKFWARRAWPEWLLLSEICFAFLIEIDESVRRVSFNELIEIQFSPHSLREDEKKIKGRIPNSLPDF